MTTTEPTPEAVEELARELDDLLDIGKYAMGDAPTSRDYAQVFLTAGYVSPKEHHETLNDYGQAVGDLNLANFRLADVEALAAGWDAEGRKEGNGFGAGLEWCAEQLRAALREFAPGDDEECIDDTDLCEHGLRFGCEECSPPPTLLRPGGYGDPILSRPPDVHDTIGDPLLHWMGRGPKKCTERCEAATKDYWLVSADELAARDEAVRAALESGS